LKWVAFIQHKMRKGSRKGKKMTVSAGAWKEVFLFLKEMDAELDGYLEEDTWPVLVDGFVSWIRKQSN